MTLCLFFCAPTIIKVLCANKILGMHFYLTFDYVRIRGGVYNREIFRSMIAPAIRIDDYYYMFNIYILFRFQR